MADFSEFQGRQCPDWFARPQMGIFVHWGIYSVPAWAPTGRSIHDLMRHDYDNATALGPYAEWYGNAVRVADSPTAKHHKTHFGNASYDDFRATFDAAAEHFDAESWAQTFADAGASYVVFVTKHHDGYCLWPTQVDHPHRAHWHTERDFVGELAQAVRSRGMRFGLYYSGGLDWTFYHAPIRNMGDMLACVPTGDDYRAYASAQVRELIARYKPSVLWNDIAWPNKADVPSLFADYYADVPDGVVNDRWLGETRLFENLRTPGGLASFNNMMKARITATDGALEMSKPPFCDFRTVEYGLGVVPPDQKWEACRGVGNSFGYCAPEPETDYLTHDALQNMRASVFAKGGNLLINIGPMADGTIPDIQRRALLGEAALR
jgi:alpha-L-fucosidase